MLEHLFSFDYISLNVYLDVSHLSDKYPFAVVSYKKNDGAPDFHKDHLKDGKTTFFCP